MYQLARWLGVLAAMTWLLLALFVAGSALFLSGPLLINLAVAVLFACISIVLWWRVRAVEAVRSALPSDAALRPLLRVDAVTSAAMLLLGAMLLYAAGLRVVGEGVPVFG